MEENMTGPLFFPHHPHRRRARLLLPSIAAILVGQLACSSDQPTEPTANIKAQTVVATSGPHPRAKLAPSRVASSSSAKALLSFKASPSFGVGQASSSEGPSVLILADTDAVSTSALAASLADSGVQVTVRPAPEYTWDGTNPSLDGFDAVIHLNGSTYDFPLPAAGQAALTSFVQNGGGFVGSQWDGYETQLDLRDLVLLDMGFDPNGPEHNCSACTVTLERLPAGEGHPVLEGLPASFSVAADGHDAGPAKDFATVLMQVSSGGPAVLVRELGSGRVVNFSFAANYPWTDEGGTHELLTLKDANVQQLYLNAVRWAAASSGVVVSVPQTITFEPVGDKVYGDAPFSLSASASSGLPVSFTAAGGCSVNSSTVTIFEAGNCTITAHQSGDATYAAADDVSRSLSVSKAAASLEVAAGTFIYDGAEKNVGVTSSPAGLNGVFVTYKLNGAAVVGLPVNAGVYLVTATLNNPNYQADSATGTLTITKAPAVITVGTQFTYDGTVKSANVTTNPAGLSAAVVLTYSQNGAVTQPINVGVYQVSATLNHPNYLAPAASGTLTIVPATPDLHWSPAALGSGTPLGPSQLNATATGAGGVPLIGGTFTYSPAAGTAFTGGTYTLSVQFAPASGNYVAASKSVSITVSSAMAFVGFFAPVKNLPFVNSAKAGSAIPVKFTVGGYRGRNVLRELPTSVAVACPAGAPENAVRPGIAGVEGLRSLGYSYNYVWKTSPSWEGTCRKLVVTLADGSTHEALFRFPAKLKTPPHRIFRR
jgi:hypothetical protein